MNAPARTSGSRTTGDDMLVPSAEDQELARRGKVVLLDAFRRHAATGEVTARLSLDDGDGHHDVELPTSTARLLLRVLEYMGEGRAISLTPQDAEVSTQVAADILNVSRPFVVKLVESGEMPCRRVGTHRRLRMTDVLAKKQDMEAEYEQAARDLTAIGQELGGYD